MGSRQNLFLLCTHFGNEASIHEARGFHNRFLATLYALENLAWRYQLKEALQRDNLLLSVLNPKLGVTEMFDFAQTHEIYLRARQRLRYLLDDAWIVATTGE